MTDSKTYHDLRTQYDGLVDGIHRAYNENSMTEVREMLPEAVQLGTMIKDIRELDGYE